jgi:GTP-binding protein
MTPLFDAISSTCRRTRDSETGRCSCRSASLDYSNYVGRIGIGRIQRGKIKPAMEVAVIDREGKKRKCAHLQVLGFRAWTRMKAEAQAGRHRADQRHRGLGISVTVTAGCARPAADADGGRADHLTMTFRSTLARWPVAAASSSPAARSATA